MKSEYEKGNSDVRSHDPRKTERLFLRMALVIIMGVIGISFLFFAPKGEGASVANPEGQITYPVKTFQDGKARFYQFKSNDWITIKYFLLKSSDGVIRAAFDACDVCWPEGKGYVQKGDYMVCRNCGRRFASVYVNVITGGCNPGALQREVVGDKLIIKVKDILDGRKYFTFSGRG